jgi:hypothetical protein
MFHSWLLTITCSQCPQAEYKLRIPVMTPGWFEPGRCRHCTRAQMKEMLDPPKNHLHDDCPTCHPELQPAPVVTWKGKKTPIGGVWSMKMVEGQLHVELERPKKKRASSPKR